MPTAPLYRGAELQHRNHSVGHNGVLKSRQACVYRQSRATALQVKDKVAVHVPCSSSKMGISAAFMNLAQRCAGSVQPSGVPCCGMAGDRGMRYPELTSAALQVRTACLLACLPTLRMELCYHIESFVAVKLRLARSLARSGGRFRVILVLLKSVHELWLQLSCGRCCANARRFTSHVPSHC